jgi:hypothetical protein
VSELTPAQRAALIETIGHEARMISYSKSGYHERNPDHVALFNANVCLDTGKIWWGDLDLTRDEPKLVELARRLGKTVYVLAEPHGRFEHEDAPLLDEAYYSVTPSGHNRFQHEWHQRAADGTLRRRPPPRSAGRRLVLPLGRPRLWRFWRAEIRRSAHGAHGPHGRELNTLIYLGRTHAPFSKTPPLLVLGHHRAATGSAWRDLEWTWYPARRRHAPRPLLHFRLQRRVRSRRLYLSLLVHPGLAWTLHVGYTADGGRTSLGAH